jgi:hypothetical protein
MVNGLPVNSGSISLLLPTRGRPELVERFFASLLETTSRLDLVEVILYVDEDDTGSHHLDSREFHVKRIIGPALSMGGYNSACFERASGEIIILANDDIVIRTQGWDERVRAINARFKDKIYLAYPNDLFKKSKFCTFPIMSRRTCELLIEPYPVAYQRFFIDPHLFDIFKRLQHTGYDRVFYCDDLIFEHLHYRTGKAPYDETYGYGRKGRFADDPTFINLTGMRSAAANRLACAIGAKSITCEVHKTDKNEMPDGVASAVFFFSRKFLLDKELPYRWRIFLWYYFIGRYLAANGFLRPFVQ